MGAPSFIIAPASLYPSPEARLITVGKGTVHRWSCGEEQPEPASNPPDFLKGWNHVELDCAGNLLAVVPLHAILKLDARSRVLWRLQLPAHHDLALEPNGGGIVLCEEPSVVEVDGDPYVILDHCITRFTRDGDVRDSLSLYEVLVTNDALRDAVISEIRRKSSVGAQDQAQEILARHDGGWASRGLLRELRELPGSPCDVLHPNTVEILPAHPQGVWNEASVLMALRSLDVIVVIDPETRSVEWQWGQDELSGPHQPSATPAGNILVFDNGVSSRRSRVVEVDPRNGSIAWEFKASPPESFFCEVAGGCELLPSGGVLVADAQGARVFEVARSGSVVWEQSITEIPSPVNAHRTSIYRAGFVSPDVVARVLRSSADSAGRRTGPG